ncbi:MAG: hypothetical protein F6K30_24685 [Cyanothece sp. SIO2G6]|nr:hypothetical protein [Cyanothece sp. SIO2G6]
MPPWKTQLISSEISAPPVTRSRSQAPPPSLGYWKKKRMKTTLVLTRSREHSAMPCLQRSPQTREGDRIPHNNILAVQIET